MSTQFVNPYGLGYDPYLAQRINAALNGQNYMSQYSNLLQYPTTQTQATQQATVSPDLSQEKIAAEYEKKLAEIRKTEEAAQKGFITQDAKGNQIQVQSDGYVATDGANDGKISFGKKLLNFGKGIVKTFTGMFTDKNGKFSLKKTLKTAVIAGVCIGASIVCPGVGTALCYAGLALGGISLAKNGYKAATAKTDQEAEQAWQGIGTGATITAMSIAGVKAKGAAVNKATGAERGFFKDLGAGFKSMNKDLLAARDLISEGNYISTVKGNVAREIFGKQTWEGVKAEGYVKSAWNNFKNKITGGNEYLANAQKATRKEYERLTAELEKEGLTEAAKAEINSRIATLGEKQHILQDSTLTTPEAIAAKRTTLNTQLKTAQETIANLDAQLSTATKAEQANITAEIASKGQEINQINAQLDALKVHSAAADKSALRMAYHNLKSQSAGNVKPALRSFTKASFGLSSNPRLVQIEAISNATSAKETLATEDPETCAALNQQNQQAIAAQRQALEQEYQALLASQGSATGTGTSTSMVQPGTADAIMNGWRNQYGI